MSTPSRFLSVTEAARAFADVVNRAFYRNETTVLTRNGVAVAHVAPASPTGIPASELSRRWEQLFHLTPTEAAKFHHDINEARAGVGKPEDRWE